MFFNHFKIAWRNLSRSKGYSLINITGLATGMAVTALRVGKALETEFPADFEHVSFSSWPAGSLLAFGDKKLNATGRLVQPAFTKMGRLHLYGEFVNGKAVAGLHQLHEPVYCAQ